MRAEITALESRCAELNEQRNRHNVRGEIGLAMRTERQLADVTTELTRKRAQLASAEAAQPRTAGRDERERAQAEIEAAAVEAGRPFSDEILRRAVGLGDELQALIFDALAERDARRKRFDAATVLANELGLTMPREPALLARPSLEVIRRLIAGWGAAAGWRNRESPALVSSPNGIDFVELVGETIEILASDLDDVAGALYRDGVTP